LFQSLFGCFVENGPYLIQRDGSFVANPWSWYAVYSTIQSYFRPQRRL
jgi:carboxypeptidase C (cathepsin A)